MEQNTQIEYNGVTALLLSNDVSNVHKEMIIMTMMEQFCDLVRAAKKGDSDIIYQLAENVPELWNCDSLKAWLAEADSYCVYEEEFQ